TGQVGPQLAEQMDLPQVVGVKKVEKKGNSLRLMRTSDGFLEVIEAPLPVLITISREAGFPQLPSLLDIQQAYINSKIDLAALEDLDVGENKVGLSGSGTWVTELTQVFKKKKCTFIDGDQRQQARTLIEKFIEKDLIG
ncbi:MAG TPA: hypothetical protein VMW42_04325, partial [Desulfatiglandales bacterium]|nr:hypothetical protein [Desulfatiglandales bacterium]